MDHREEKPDSKLRGGVCDIPVNACGEGSCGTSVGEAAQVCGPLKGKPNGEGSRGKPNGKPTRLFVSYTVHMVLRFALLVLGVAAFACAPGQISIAESFGLAGGFNLVDLVFLAVVADMLTKFFPHAKISMGSLKQYGEFHVPTVRMFRGGKEGALAYIREVVTQGRIARERIAEQLPAQIRIAWEETRVGTRDSLKVLVRSIDFLRIIPFKEEQLAASEEARNQIRHDRFREILPVAVAWVALNVAVACALTRFGQLNELVCVVWMLFYFLFDMVCVVLWCPIQLLLMRNRCCTTCQIFNWDAIMTVTPLLFLAGNLECAWFTWPLLAMGVVVLVRWELAFARHPERFDERTNASLSCANCKDKLCYVREPLAHRLSDIPGLTVSAHVAGVAGVSHSLGAEEAEEAQGA